MLTNLKELNLSFNFIEKIENLETLVNLEVLSLFNNRIEVIENMDALDKLVIISLGNNLIDSVEGVSTLFNKTIHCYFCGLNQISSFPTFVGSEMKKCKK